MHTEGGLGLKGMFADVLEQTLQAEMDLHFGYDRAERTSYEGKKNYRNGTVKRTMKTSSPYTLPECPQEISKIRLKDCRM